MARWKDRKHHFDANRSYNHTFQTKNQHVIHPRMLDFGDDQQVEQIRHTKRAVPLATHSILNSRRLFKNAEKNIQLLTGCRRLCCLH